MKPILLFATTYPYACGVIAVMWLCSAILLKVDTNLSLGIVLMTNSVSTLVIALIGFRK
jgi:hypothetical protein